MAERRVDIILAARNDLADGLNKARADVQAFAAATAKSGQGFGDWQAFKAWREGEREAHDQFMGWRKAEADADSQAARVRASVQTPDDRYLAYLNEITRLHMAGKLSVEEYGRAAGKARQEMLAGQSGGGGPDKGGGTNELLGTTIKVGAAIHGAKLATDLLLAGTRAVKGDWSGVQEVLFSLPLGMGALNRSVAALRDEWTGVNDRIRESAEMLDKHNAAVREQQEWRRERMAAGQFTEGQRRKSALTGLEGQDLADKQAAFELEDARAQIKRLKVSGGYTEKEANAAEMRAVEIYQKQIAENYKTVVEAEKQRREKVAAEREKGQKEFEQWQEKERQYQEDATAAAVEATARRAELEGRALEAARLRRNEAYRKRKADANSVAEQESIGEQQALEEIAALRDAGQKALEARYGTIRPGVESESMRAGFADLSATYKSEQAAEQKAAFAEFNRHMKSVARDTTNMVGAMQNVVAYLKSLGVTDVEAA